MARFVRQARVAELARTNPGIVSVESRTKFPEARNDLGLIDIDHPVLRKWVAAQRSKRSLQPPTEAEYAAVSGTITGTTGDLSAPPMPRAIEPVVTTDYAANVLDSTQEILGAKGMTQEDLDELPNKPLWWIAERFHSFAELEDLVKSLRTHADYQNKSTMAKQRRGELVERKVIEGTVFPLIDQAFRFLVDEGPQALTQEIVPRAQAGGDLVYVEIEEMIRKSNSRPLKNAKAELIRLLGEPDAE